MPDESASTRTSSTIKRLKFYRSRAKHDRHGEVLWEPFQSKDTSHCSRIQPDRRWFDNTRVVNQGELATFRSDMKKLQALPSNTYLLKAGKVPFTLLHDVPVDKKHPPILAVEPFAETFGRCAIRRRPKTSNTTLAALSAAAQDQTAAYDSRTADNGATALRNMADPYNYKRGQSGRIWGELYKVIDSSDVVVQVLDARDPQGTRTPQIEAFLRKNCPTKHLLLLLNKADLVPTWVTKRWAAVLSLEYPVVPFHARVDKPFGKAALIQILRQFQRLHTDKRLISVGFIGYPNVGKSAVINALRGRKVCPSAPVPGHTKVWQYIRLYRQILLIDCPGVVHRASNDPDIVLKGAVRVQAIDDPLPHVARILRAVRPRHLLKAYGIVAGDDATAFLEALARKQGRLGPGNRPDLKAVGKNVIQDWISGMLPYFVLPDETIHEMNEVEMDQQEDQEEEKEPFETDPKLESELEPLETDPKLESELEPLETDPKLESESFETDPKLESKSLETNLKLESKSLETNPKLKPESEPWETNPKLKPESKPLETNPKLKPESEPLETNPKLKPESKPLETNPKLKPESKPLETNPKLKPESKPLETNPKLKPESKPLETNPKLKPKSLKTEPKPSDQKHLEHPNDMTDQTTWDKLFTDIERDTQKAQPNTPHDPNDPAPPIRLEINRAVLAADPARRALKAAAARQKRRASQRPQRDKRATGTGRRKPPAAAVAFEIVSAAATMKKRRRT